MNELVRRIAITIGALLISRVGSHIPIPLTGISAQSRLLSSGAIDRVSILPLTPVPHASAAILVQLVSVARGRLSALERSGGRTIQDVEPGEATADYLDRVVSFDDGGRSRLPRHRVADSGSPGGWRVGWHYPIKSVVVRC